jgi:hypothetical protein
VAERTDTYTSAEVADGVSGLLVGAGLITMVLFPLSIPILLLTLVSLLPLALPLVVVAVPVLVILGLVRLIARFTRPKSVRVSAPRNTGQPHGHGNPQMGTSR